jgi:hypothetical protein
MNIALIQQLMELLIEAAQVGIPLGEKLIGHIMVLWGLAQTSTTLTPDQQKLADDTYAAAKQLFLDAAASAEAEDAQTN